MRADDVGTTVPHGTELMLLVVRAVPDEGGITTGLSHYDQNEGCFFTLL